MSDERVVWRLTTHADEETGAIAHVDFPTKEARDKFVDGERNRGDVTFSTVTIRPKAKAAEATSAWAAFLDARVALLRAWRKDGKDSERMAILASCDAAQVERILRNTDVAEPPTGSGQVAVHPAVEMAADALRREVAQPSPISDADVEREADRLFELYARALPSLGGERRHGPWSYLVIAAQNRWRAVARDKLESEARLRSAFRGANSALSERTQQAIEMLSRVESLRTQLAESEAARKEAERQSLSHADQLLAKIERVSHLEAELTAALGRLALECYRVSASEAGVAGF